MLFSEVGEQYVSKPNGVIGELAVPHSGVQPIKGGSLEGVWAFI